MGQQIIDVLVLYCPIADNQGVVVLKVSDHGLQHGLVRIAGQVVLYRVSQVTCLERCPSPRCSEEEMNLNLMNGDCARCATHSGHSSFQCSRKTDTINTSFIFFHQLDMTMNILRSAHDHKLVYATIITGYMPLSCPPLKSQKIYDLPVKTTVS